MSFDVAITSWAVWNAAGVAINSAPVEGAGMGLAEWPNAPASSVGRPRSRLCPALAIAVVQLVGRLLSARQSRFPTLTLPDPVDLRVGTAVGSKTVDLEFLRSLQERGDAFGSASTFAYTLSTAAVGEVSLAFGLRGGLSTVSSGGVSGLAALVLGAGQVATGRSTACVCGGMEVSGSSADVIALFLLERATLDLRVPRLIRWGFSFDPEATGESSYWAPPGLTLEALAAALAGEKELEVGASSPEGHLAVLAVTSPGQRLSIEGGGS